MKWFLSISLISVILLSCSLKEVIDLAANKDQLKPPKWDMKFDVPLIEKTENLNKYFTVPNVVGASISMPPVTMFMYLPGSTALNNLPVIPGLLDSQDIEPTAISQPILIDLNEDGTNDVTVESLSSSTGFVSITISMTKDGVKAPMLPGDISLTSIEIEAVNYVFAQPEKATADGKLVFKTKNFLSDSLTPIRPDNTGDVNQIDVSIRPDFIKFNTLNKTSLLDGKDLSNPLVLATTLLAINDSGTVGQYGFDFDVVFSFGTDFKIEGVVNEETSLFKIENQTVPLTESQNFISTFIIKLQTENRLPIEISIQNSSFSNSGFTIPIVEIFEDDTTSDIISVPLGYKSTKLTTTDSIFNKGSLGLNLDLVIPQGAQLQITDNMYIQFIMGLSAEGQIDLQYY
ncbi:MAG: hypothetical protein A2015_11830 [Spirochaetes bacterium GWF1_31_7]|nr:MAG: hypothetical protein A2Y30_15245 [Spirochaetes bacterium GWE1_32_154]OHD49108.1 MAG: hypothetical protein A2015_11830 [Spirochaetes bacterium GWF1_31_7]OHD50306.1 MAG: hypothetical protein A2Y29_13295 [Spirochaetes bacterium GWE2_31_10]OHD77457.1 MAG: hypothetical protein A2355_09935 [Spirochaetes bacterium RIFOXYB1_FULL_32_8]HBI38786.1 hypothetical protein [Spirochaetia bacterium]